MSRVLFKIAFCVLAIGTLFYFKSTVKESSPMGNFDATKTIIVKYGSANPQHAVIWLHGLGASADDFPPVVPHLGLTENLNIRFIFPQAPERAITINNGMSMPGWYDIKGPDLLDKEDLVGMLDSQSVLDNLIDEQIDLGIASENIIIAGFSQGGAVAYYAGIRSQHKLRGIMTLSTYLSFQSQTKEEQSGVNVQTPILAMHGKMDPIVPFATGIQSADFLKDLGYLVEWHAYDMDHTVIIEQLKDIGTWMNKLLAK